MKVIVRRRPSEWSERRGSSSDGGRRRCRWRGRHSYRLGHYHRHFSCYLHPPPPPHHHPFSTLVMVSPSSPTLAKTFVRTKTNWQTAALHKIGKAASRGLHNSHLFIAIQHLCRVLTVKREWWHVEQGEHTAADSVTCPHAFPVDSRQPQDRQVFLYLNKSLRSLLNPLGSTTQALPLFASFTERLVSKHMSSGFMKDNLVLRWCKTLER